MAMTLQELEDNLERLSYCGTDREAQDAAAQIKSEIIGEWKRPRVGVGIIVFNGYKILLEKRRSSKGHGDSQISVPGGWLEHGESFEMAARRELFEETGLSFDYNNAQFAGCTSTVFPSGLHCITGFIKVHWIDWTQSLPDIPVGGNPIIREPEKCSMLEWHEAYKALRPPYPLGELFPPIATFYASHPEAFTP